MQNERFAGHPKWLVETACLLKSNTLYGPGDVGWPSRWELYMIFRRENRFFNQFHQFKFDRSIFPTYFGIIPCCMQKLSSMHRLGEKFDWVQGFGPWWVKIWKSRNFAEKCPLLAENDVWKFKIALLMQNWRFAGHWMWLVETACFLESDALYGPGHVGWQSWWDKCNDNFWKSRVFYEFHQIKFARSIFPT